MFPLFTHKTLWGDAVSTWEVRMVRYDNEAEPRRVIYCETRFDEGLTSHMQAAGFYSYAGYPRGANLDQLKSELQAHIVQQMNMRLGTAPGTEAVN